MPSSWRKVENENGFIYYVNEATKVTQWDHPKFAEIKQRLDDCNYIKYSTYRVASKFRVLQQALYKEIPLKIIAGVFERHRLGITEGSLCLESCDLEAVLSDIYFAANKQNHTNTDIDFATELTLNFLYNVFDKDRDGKIQVLSTKLILAILSNCQLRELNQYIFNLCSDHNNCVTRLRLQTVLTKLASVTNFLHEDSTFGQHLVNSSVAECFSNSPGLVGINETTFISWMESNPQFLAWLSILHRIKLSESVIHSAKCSVCKTTPLLGLRYRCIKCSRYTQCQRCFLTARTSHSHKLSHSMREYCSESNTKEFTHAFLKKLCKFLHCSVRYGQSNFAVEAIETRPCNADKDWLLKSSPDVNCEIKPLSSPQAQLQVVIRQLELQNKELQHVLMLGNRSDKEMKRYLEEHRLHVAAQIHKLKMLKDYLKISQPLTVTQTKPLNTVESTPLVPNGKNFTRAMNLDLLSPICQLPETYIDESQNNLEEMPYSINNFTSNNIPLDNSSVSYTTKDISTWIGGKPSTSYTHTTSDLDINLRKSPVRAMHNDLDDALAKLQQILANNFTLDESLGNIDNGQLKHAVTEVEGMLTSLIDSVENSRANSVQQFHENQETDLFTGNYKFT